MRRSVTIAATDAVVWKTDTFKEARTLVRGLAQEAAEVAVADWDENRRDVSVEITIKMTERRA